MLALFPAVDDRAAESGDGGFEGGGEAGMAEVGIEFVEGDIEALAVPGGPTKEAFDSGPFDRIRPGQVEPPGERPALFEAFTEALEKAAAAGSPEGPGERGLVLGGGHAVVRSVHVVGRSSASG